MILIVKCSMIDIGYDRVFYSIEKTNCHVLVESGVKHHIPHHVLTSVLYLLRIDTAINKETKILTVLSFYESKPRIF